MRYNDSLDALTLWQKYYPDKAKKTLESLRAATAMAQSTFALQDSLRAVGQSAKNTAEAIEKIANIVSTTSTSSTIDTLNEIQEYVASGGNLSLEEEKSLDSEYRLTEVHSDVKFDWEQTEFTSMTNLD